MKKRTKKLLIGSGIAAAGVVLIGTVYRRTAKKLMTIALDRAEPKARKRDRTRLSGSEKPSEIVTTVTEASDALQSLGLETVELTGHDGVRLVGHWYCPDRPKRVLIAMHGWRSSWSRDFGVIAPFWQENDCAVLYAEQRGQGDSGGDYMGFGLLERYDCLDWIGWVNEKTNSSLPVYLYGVSMGATTVLMTAGFDLPENVCGVIADCGFTSPHAIWKHVMENNLHIPYGIYSAAAKDICEQKIHIAADACSCTDALRECNVPVLFIHGTDDRFVPVEMTYENYKACASPKRLLIVPEASHAMSYLTDRERYEHAVGSFWKEFDRVPEVHPEQETCALES